MGSMSDSIVLIRSGATAFDLEQRIRGTLDMPLCDEGLREAEHCAEMLGTGERTDQSGAYRGKVESIKAIYSSKALCALHTCRIVAQRLDLRPQQLAQLENLNQGLWQGMLVSEIRLRQPRLYRQWQENPWSICPPDGELLEQAVARVETVLAKLKKKHRTGRIALVVPEPLEQIVRWILAGEPIQDLWLRNSDRPLVIELPINSQWQSGDRIKNGQRNPSGITS